MEKTKQHIRSAVTLALVPGIRTGPWIFWDDLEAGLRQAAGLGFDGVELFTASADAVDARQLQALRERHAVDIAAVGTGAGKVLHGLTLTDPDPSVREKAINFIGAMIDFGSSVSAPAIIGSMQGNVAAGVERDRALAWLAESLERLGRRAGDRGVRLIYEPLNRYETNLFNRVGDAADFLKRLDTGAVRLLADLFHMNIEEADIAGALRDHAEFIGHVHFADSNRRPMGLGHTDMAGIARALRETGYAGYVSAEAFPHPTPEEAAAQTIRSFRKWFRDRHI